MMRQFSYLISWIAAVLLSTGVLIPGPVWAARPYMLAYAPGVLRASLPIDLEMVAPEPRVFPSDTTPDECLAAARKMQSSLQHRPAGAEPQPGDTVGLDKTAPVARACGARFTVANTPVADLDSLFQLALYEQNDALAQAVVAKLLPQRMTWEPPRKLPKGVTMGKSLSNPASDSGGNFLASVMMAYSDFGRLAAASALVTQVTVNGPSDYYFQLQYHTLLARRLVAQQPGDDVRLLQELEAILHLAEARATTTDSTKLDDITYFANWNTYPALFKMLWEQHADSATVWALAARVKRDMVRYRYATQWDHFSNEVVELFNQQMPVNHWPGWESMTVRQVFTTEGTTGPWASRWP